MRTGMAMDWTTCPPTAAQWAPPKGLYVLVAALWTLSATTPAEAAGHNGGLGKIAPAVAAGPFILLLALAAAAVFILCAMALGRRAALARATAAAVDDLGRARFLHLGSGLLFEVLIISGGVVCVRLPHLGVLGVLVWAAGLVLSGLGASVAAHAAGRRFREDLGDDTSGGNARDLAAGLALLFFAAAIPVVGWISVALSAAAGVGALVNGAVRRTRA
ncbi:MAG: hypothetical protein ACLQVD_09850 [Capsulimonadaceae bacterium]